MAYDPERGVYYDTGEPATTNQKRMLISLHEQRGLDYDVEEIEQLSKWAASQAITKLLQGQDDNTEDLRAFAESFPGSHARKRPAAV